MKGKFKDKKVYLKLIENVGIYSVWLIDGQYIRKNINENFVEYDHHYNHRFVPKKEIWIDEETNREERKFFLNHVFIELGLLKIGEDYDSAEKTAIYFEKKERNAEIKKNRLDWLKDNKKELMEKIHKKFLSHYSGDVAVWLVDGRLVRDFFLADYAEGGHDKVYSFIPINEVWIDKVLADEEINFIVLHELHERFLMSQGKKYSEAHKSATLVEDYYRDHAEKLEEKIKEEIENNNKITNGDGRNRTAVQKVI